MRNSPVFHQRCREPVPQVPRWDFVHRPPRLPASRLGPGVATFRTGSVGIIIPEMGMGISWKVLWKVLDIYIYIEKMGLTMFNLLDKSTYLINPRLSSIPLCFIFFVLWGFNSMCKRFESICRIRQGKTPEIRKFRISFPPRKKHHDWGGIYIGGSINGGTQKWMVYKGKSH